MNSSTFRSSKLDHWKSVISSSLHPLMLYLVKVRALEETSEVRALAKKDGLCALDHYPAKNPLLSLFIRYFSVYLFWVQDDSSSSTPLQGKRSQTLTFAPLCSLVGIHLLGFHTNILLSNLCKWNLDSSEDKTLLQ